MKIPPDALIPREKLIGYLLVFKDEDDKSGFLAQGGFTLQNPDLLEAALRQHINTTDAEVDRENQYGIFTVCKGN